MSRPHSAIRTCAALAWTPGIVESNSTISSVRGEHELDPLAQVLQRGVERVDMREQLRDHHPVMLDRKRLWSASLSSGIFARILPLDSSASCSGSVTPAGALRASRARTSSRSLTRRLRA